jgi:putative acetyltransferase
MTIHIKKYDDAYREAMISLWERSVRATHDFLLKDDIDYFKTLVQGIDFKTFDVYCAFDEKDTLLAILGVAERKLEMLFLDPKFIGKGVGKHMMLFALKELEVDQVDVNEGNLKATRFYESFGFRVYDRTPLDDHGKPYPILKMRLVV